VIAFLVRIFSRSDVNTAKRSSFYFLMASTKREKMEQSIFGDVLGVSGRLPYRLLFSPIYWIKTKLGYY